MNDPADLPGPLCLHIRFSCMQVHDAVPILFSARPRVPTMKMNPSSLVHRMHVARFGHAVRTSCGWRAGGVENWTLRPAHPWTGDTRLAGSARLRTGCAQTNPWCEMDMPRAYTSSVALGAVAFSRVVRLAKSGCPAHTNSTPTRHDEQRRPIRPMHSFLAAERKC